MNGCCQSIQKESRIIKEQVYIKSIRLNNDKLQLKPQCIYVNLCIDDYYKQMYVVLKVRTQSY